MKEKKSGNKRFLKISIVLYIVIIAIIVVYTVSWFITNRRVEVGTNEEISINVGAKLEILQLDKEDANWSTSIKINTADDLSYSDITGNGLKFYFPTYLDGNDQPNTNDVESYKEVKDGDTNLITIRLKVRTADNIDLYLSNASYVMPEDEETKDALFSGGQFANDYIAGASRVAFIEVVDGEEVLKNVWIPNDEYELTYPEKDMATFTKTGTREESYTYQTVNGNAVETITYTADDFANGLVTVGSKNLAFNVASDEENATIPPMINSGAPILSFTDSNAVQEKELIIRMWFEGTDREADKAFNGGRVKYNVSFVGIIKDNASTADVERLNTLQYRNGQLYFGAETEAGTGFLYSLNGIDWSEYNKTNLTTSNVGTVGEYVYVKTKETSSVKSSEVVKIPTNLT